MQSMAPLMVMLVHEIVIGVVLGATARVTLSALQVAGSVIAQQLGWASSPRSIRPRGSRAS